MVLCVQCSKTRYTTRGKREECPSGKSCIPDSKAFAYNHSDISHGKLSSYKYISETLLERSECRPQWRLYNTWERVSLTKSLDHSQKSRLTQWSEGRSRWKALFHYCRWCCLPHKLQLWGYQLRPMWWTYMLARKTGSRYCTVLHRLYHWCESTLVDFISIRTTHTIPCRIYHIVREAPS